MDAYQDRRLALLILFWLWAGWLVMLSDVPKHLLRPVVMGYGLAASAKVEGKHEATHRLSLTYSPRKNWVQPIDAEVSKQVFDSVQEGGLVAIHFLPSFWSRPAIDLDEESPADLAWTLAGVLGAIAGMWIHVRLKLLELAWLRIRRRLGSAAIGS